MGNACSSCLGNRRREDYDEDDESRLFDDPDNLHYGSFSDPPMVRQDDPLEVQREIEALQRVVARTSDNMVDIFEIAPPAGEAPRPSIVPSQYAFAGQEARMARYQSLLSKLSSEDLLQHHPGVPPSDHEVRLLQPLSVGSTPSTKVDWVSWSEEEDNIEMRHGGAPGVIVVKTEGDEPLVGTFADAAAAVS